MSFLISLSTTEVVSALLESYSLKDGFEIEKILAGTEVARQIQECKFSYCHLNILWIPIHDSINSL